MSEVKKLLSSSRTLVVLLSITMGFTIAIYFDAKKEAEHRAKRGMESPPPKVADVDVNLPVPGHQEGLEDIQAKLDKMTRDIVVRDTIIVREVLRLQHQAGMHPEKHPMCPSCAGKSQNIARQDANFH